MKGCRGRCFCGSQEAEPGLTGTRQTVAEWEEEEQDTGGSERPIPGSIQRLTTVCRPGQGTQASHGTAVLEWAASKTCAPLSCQVGDQALEDDVWFFL